jgi:SPP1 family predicted phage head-tail adaptor
MTRYKINAGKYKHIVTFQKLVETTNEYGEIIRDGDTNWEDFIKARVGIYPISSKEIVQAKMTESEITHRIQMRYDPTFVINSHMRIKYGSRIFDIVSPPINYQEANREIEMLCKERPQD